MNDNAQIIKEFIEAWSTLDAAKLAGYFAEDGCYHNMPLEPVIGRENVREFIAGFVTAWTKTDWEIINLVESGNIVIAERLDKTKSAQGDVDLPCVGIFEMEGGKIKVWRDYFDMSTYANAMAS
jgi:limonene-1,2-epoxide hydrolase